VTHQEIQGQPHGAAATHQALALRQSDALWGSGPVTPNAADVYQCQVRLTNGAPHTVRISFSAEAVKLFAKEQLQFDPHTLEEVDSHGKRTPISGGELYQMHELANPLPRGAVYDPETKTAVFPELLHITGKRDEYTEALEHFQPVPAPEHGDVSGPLLKHEYDQLLQLNPISAAELAPLQQRWTRLQEGQAKLDELRRTLPESDPRQLLLRNSDKEVAAANRGLSNTARQSDEAARLHQDGEKRLQALVAAKTPLSKEVLDDLNVAFGSGAVQRDHQVFASNGGDSRSVREYLHPQQVDAAMNEFLQFHHGPGQQLPAPQRAMEAGRRLMSIHFHDDGNGRTSRAAMNLVLQSAGFPPTTQKDTNLAIFPRAHDNQPPLAHLEQITAGMEKTLSFYEALLKGPNVS
jgi:hypothetical protein